MILFSFALGILLVGSLPWAATVKLPNKPAWLMALYLIASANVVLTGYIANSFQLLNKQWAMLTIHTGLGIIGWLIWRRVGKPDLWGPFQDWHPKVSLEWLRREPVLSLLASMIGLLYAFALVQIILIPQNNSDSLSTHLSRIGFWHQQGSFFPWPTFMLNQVWYPVNAQLQTYWTLLFLGNDHLVGIVQWLAALITGVGVYGMARFYDYRTRQSAFACLIFLSFPLVALQSTTTQTDLVAMAFFIPAVYFLVAGLKEKQNSLLFLSAISIGIGVGVKKSYFLLLPLLAIPVLLTIFQFGKQIYKRIVLWSLSVAIGVSLFGAYNYVVNWKVWGGPFGPPAYVELLLDTSQNQQATPAAPKVKPQLNMSDSSIVKGDDTFPGSEILLKLAYNTPRLLYQALDTSGLPRPLDGYAHKVKMYLTRPFFQWVGFDEIEGTAYTAPGHTFSFSDKNINEESHAWYGPLSVLLLFPALVVGFYQGIRSKNYLLLTPGIALLVFFPMEIILRPGWDPYQGRYFAPLVALGAPLMAIWFKRESSTAIYEWLISVLAIEVLFVTLLYNPSKPTLGKYADEFHIWNNDRIFIQTIQRKNERELFYKVDKFVPVGSTLGYYIPFFIMDYPLFGENLERHLIPITSKANVADAEWLRGQGIDYLLMPQRGGIPLPPPEYQSIIKLDTWVLYKYSLAP